MNRLSFDIGGTFPDFVLRDAAGETHTLTVPSTPHDPAEAVLNGLNRLLSQSKCRAEAIDTILHATTVATNAVIERTGGRTALITTEGFRDVLIIGRQKRYETYDLYLKKPAPLVPRRDILEVRERIGFDGEIIEKLDDESLDEVAERLAAGGYDAIAVALLHAYANPDHERRIRDRLAAVLPETAVSISSEVSPKFREYERSNTTVANSYIKPLVSQYIARLETTLAEKGFRNDFFIMQSNGGLVSPELARDFPIKIVESGPAAGVLMARDIGAAEGQENVISFDMGGTTAKLGAIDDGAPAIVPTFEIDPVRYKPGSGLPISIPAVELLEIGAGGGSIARAELGTIAVGPESAGADPGPICYGQGGERPTVTDANLVLGYLDPDYFNDGALRLDQAAAAACIARDLADPLGLTPEEAAWGVHLIATNNMEYAIRLVSVERGRDPRKYAMVAFGGAGPLHAARLARKIGVPKVIVPNGAGVGSAIGLLRAEPKIDASTTRLLRMNETTGDTLRAIYEDLETRIRANLERLGAAEEPDWSRFAYMRHAGQGFEIHVPLPDGAIGDDYPASAATAFREGYARRHQFSDGDGDVEGVDWYLVATLPTATDTATSSEQQPGPSRRTGSRPAYFPETGGFVETRILDRAKVAEETALAGPAIIEDPDSTTVVPPGDRIELSAEGHLVILIGQEGGT